MPISRAAFQIGPPGRIGIGARQVARALEQLESAAGESVETAQRTDTPTAKSAESFTADSATNELAEEKFQQIGAETSPNLPPADASSAGTQEGIGPTQPQTETRRSVATGRDAPPAGQVPQNRGEMDVAGGPLHERARIVEGRLQKQTNETAAHLSGIHEIVGRLLELTEASVFEGGEKLRALEQRLAQLEMRYSVNRNSP